MDLVQRLRDGEGGMLLYGISPPKASTPADRLDRITERTLGRLDALGPDGLVLYDIADEEDRNGDERPFPYLETLDPADYLDDRLSAWGGPTIVYRAVGKYEEHELSAWMAAQDPERVVTVLVGASSSAHVGATSLRRAYELRREAAPDLLAGAVVIPERHASRGDEHDRMLAKQQAGVGFFVSQILYDATAAKNLVVDYADACAARGAAPRPIVFTHSVCGSTKTLEFLAWLGVQVPHWMRRDLERADSTLEASCAYARDIAADVVAYARRLGVPAGLNVESVSTRRAENETALWLARKLRGVLDG